MLNEIQNKYNELKIISNDINNQLTNKIDNEINAIKEENENYITLKVNIDKENIGKDITFLKQKNNFPDYNNFEINDLEIFIDDKIIPLKYNKLSSYKKNEESKDCEEAQYLSYLLKTSNYFYWNFATEGIHTIKIIFKKKVISCEDMFSNCENIIEIDLSHFKSSNVSSCNSMFKGCNLLRKINFGNLDFKLCQSFREMFCDCKNCIELNISKFNTENCKSCYYMFENCISLKTINLGTLDFKYSNNFEGMFFGCENLIELDVSTFNTENCRSCCSMFKNCFSLLKINLGTLDFKLSTNFSKIKYK